MPKLVYIVTVPITAKTFLSGQLSFMREHGFDVLVIASPGPELEQVARQEKVRVFGIPMEREISPIQDVITLWRLYRLLRRERPDIVNASTPKAGLLGMLAAWLAVVPIRIYLVRGLRLETASGWKRSILGLTERLAAACANRVVCNSPSLLAAYCSYAFASVSKLAIVGPGSSNGVDADRFLPSPTLVQRAETIREKFNIPEGATVIGFIGRFTRDKGIVELIQAFTQLQSRYAGLYLLMVGDFEKGDPVPLDIVRQIRANPRVKLVGFVSDTAPYYHVMDILAFPSYREGFPNAPLEAGVAGVPTVGFVATGVIDAVQDGQTGLLVSLKSAEALAAVLERLINDPVYRKRLGEQAQARVLATFRAQEIWRRWLEYYNDCLSKSSTRSEARI